MQKVKVTKWNKKTKPDLVELKKKLISQGLDPYVFESYHGEYYSEHVHEHDEIRIVIEGEMTFGADGKEITLQEGDKLELLKGTVHWAENRGKKRAVLLSASKY